MKKSIWTGTCAAIVGFATTAMIAQAPQTPPAPPQAPQETAASTEGKVTVTGCLKTAPPDATANTTGAAGTTGTAGTAGAASPNAATDAKFLLTDATSAPAAPSDSSAAPAPPTAPSATTPAGSTYRLIANPSALTPHLGKKLALTGTIDKSAAMTPGAATTASSEAPMLALRVESGKIIAETCTGQ